MEQYLQSLKHKIMDEQYPPAIKVALVQIVQHDSVLCDPEKVLEGIIRDIRNAGENRSPTLQGFIEKVLYQFKQERGDKDRPACMELLDRLVNQKGA
jgi:hypothetical protein